MSKSISFIVLLWILVFSACTHSGENNPKVFELAPGWAKTSVNTGIFRKNSVISHDGHQYVAWYDSVGYVIIGQRLLGTDDWHITRTGLKGNVNDAHNIISIMVDDEGFLHIAWDHHGGPLNYCISKKPGSMEFTDRLPMVGSYEDGDVTYPEFYKLPGGDLLFVYRYGGSGRGNLVMNRYDAKNRKWNRVHDNLIDGEGERNAYWQMCVDGQGVIHLSWVWRETWDVFTNHDLCYAKSDDGGVTWKTSGGTVLDAPMTLNNAEYALKIPQGSSLINQTSITADDKGRPYISSYWTPNDGDVPQFFVVFLQDGKWKVSQVTDRQMAFSLKGGGSRRIPVSRPQVIFSGKNQTLHVIYRDREQDNKICISSAKVDREMDWKLETVSGISVGQWEPTYDTELWKKKEQFHLFVQNVGQGEGGEMPEDIDPQMVKILEFDYLSDF